MKHSVLNLLPPERTDALVAAYRRRLGVVVVSLVLILIAVAAMLLVPAHWYLHESLARITAATATPSDAANAAALEEQLQSLRATLRALGAATSARTSTSVVADVMSVPRAGITLTSFSYTTTGAAGQSVIVSGTASTRAALQNYMRQLKSAAFVKTAELPVSAYAKDTGLPFAITLTLTP